MGPNPNPKKRRADPGQRVDHGSKRAKGKKQWAMPRKDAAEARGIQPGDVGIWATCAMKKEGRSVAELRDLFEEYASKLYGAYQIVGAAEDEEPNEEQEEEDGGDIEAEIKKELECIRKPATKPLFASVKLDTQCLIFFKTQQPIEPVSFVHKICQDAADGIEQKRCRFVKRLTPITAIDKATERGLEDVSQLVLAPHFHGPDQPRKKFAIRTSIRNNKDFTRDKVIKKVAAAVGSNHQVDLSGYDVLILVEIYQNVLGMGVVGSDFETLKRFNLAELHDPGEGNREHTPDARLKSDAAATATGVEDNGTLSDAKVEIREDS